MQDGNMLVEDETNIDAVRESLKTAVRKTYAYHRPSEEGIGKIAEVRKAFSDLHDKIELLAPNSREKSVALTNLETTAMWAIKAIVCNDPKSEIAN